MVSVSTITLNHTHSHSQSLKMFSAVIAGYISGSLFPACCERADLSHCRPPCGSPPPHSSMTWGYRYALPDTRAFVKPGDPTNTEGDLQLCLEVPLASIPLHCFLCQQSTWESEGAKYFWPYGDMGVQGQFNPPRPLALRPLLLVCSSERLNECSDAQLCESSNEVRFMT